MFISIPGPPSRSSLVRPLAVHGETYYDLWMSFPMRSARNEVLSKSRFHGPTGPAWTRDTFRVSSYNIHAAIDSSLNLTADAELTGTGPPGRVAHS